MFKKIMAGFLALGMLVSISSTAFAASSNRLGNVSTDNVENEFISPRVDWESWDVESYTYTGTSYGAYKRLTVLGPADADGESFSVSQSIGASISISGQVNVGVGKLTGALGFDVGASVDVSITKNSRELSKGEKIQVDYRFMYHNYDVTQKGELHYDHTTKYSYAYCTVSKPDPFANVRFTYIKPNGTTYLVEEYQVYADGSSKMVSSTSVA